MGAREPRSSLLHLSPTYLIAGLLTNTTASHPSPATQRLPIRLSLLSCTARIPSPSPLPHHYLTRRAALRLSTYLPSCTASTRPRSTPRLPPAAPPSTFPLPLPSPASYPTTLSHGIPSPLPHYCLPFLRGCTAPAPCPSYHLHFPATLMLGYLSTLGHSEDSWGGMGQDINTSTAACAATTT